jgi:hypothetical protein
MTKTEYRKMIARKGIKEVKHYYIHEDAWTCRHVDAVPAGDITSKNIYKVDDVIIINVMCGEYYQVSFI